MTILTCEATTFPQGLQEESSVPLCDLGAKAVDDTGRAFRYVKAGATALVAGKLQQSPAIVANHKNIAVASAASAGASSVTVTLGATAATANQYAGGTMTVNDVDGQGYSYQIESHPAADASASLVLTLSDELEEALTTSSQVTLYPNIYSGVIVHPTTATGTPVGVAVKDITASYYGWIQTKGPVSCLNDGALTVGSEISPSNAVAGAVEDGVIAQGFVGRAIMTGVDTEYLPVCINLD